MPLRRLNIKLKHILTSWVVYEQESNKTWTPQNRLNTYSGATSSWSFCLFFFFPLSHLICRKWAEKFDWDTSACKLHWTLRSHWLNLQGLSELSAHWVCSMELSKCSFLQCSWCVHITVNKRNLLVQWRYNFDCKVTLSKSTMFLLKNEWKDLLDFDKSEPINSPMVAFLEISAPEWRSEISSWMSWKTVNKTTVPSRRDQRGDQIHESQLEKRAYDLPHFSDNKHQCIFLSLIETFMALFSNSQEEALMEVSLHLLFWVPKEPRWPVRCQAGTYLYCFSLCSWLKTILKKKQQL